MEWNRKAVPRLDLGDVGGLVLSWVLLWESYSEPSPAKFLFTKQGVHQTKELMSSPTLNHILHIHDSKILCRKDSEPVARASIAPKGSCVPRGQLCAGVYVFLCMYEASLCGLGFPHMWLWGIWDRVRGLTEVKRRMGQGLLIVLYLDLSMLVETQMWAAYGKSLSILLILMPL